MVEAAAVAADNSTIASADTEACFRLRGVIHLLTVVPDDDRDFDDRRQQRRRYEEPLASKVGKKLQSLCEWTQYTVEEDIRWLAKTVAENYFDSDLTARVMELCIAM